MDEERACRRCKAPLRLLTGPDGKTIPLDLRSPVYVVGQDMNGAPTAQRAPDAFVSHFSTCPFANEFSQGRKR